jgi:nucleoside-diphosphate-sugar epimerase
VEGVCHALPSSLSTERFDFIFFAAGAWRMGERCTPLEVERRCREVYVQGMEEVAALARRSLAHIVFMSGITRFGHRTSGSAMTEQSSPGPLCVYGWHKRQAEAILERATADGVRWTALCPLEVYGPNDEGSHLYFIYRRLLARRYVQLGDGRNRWSLCHVNNVVAAAMHVSSGKGEGPLLIADARAYTAREIARTVAEAAGCRASFLRVPRSVALFLSAINARVPRPSAWPEPLSPVHVRQRTTDRLLDTSRARELGFAPSFSLAEGAAQAVAWWRTNGLGNDVTGASC